MIEWFCSVYISTDPSNFLETWSSRRVPQNMCECWKYWEGGESGCVSRISEVNSAHTNVTYLLFKRDYMRSVRSQAAWAGLGGIGMLGISVASGWMCGGWQLYMLCKAFVNFIELFQAARGNIGRWDDERTKGRVRNKQKWRAGANDKGAYPYMHVYM